MRLPRREVSPDSCPRWGARFRVEKAMCIIYQHSYRAHPSRTVPFNPAHVPCHRSQVKSEVLRQVSYGVQQAHYANKWYITRTVSPMLLNILHQGTPSELCEIWCLHRTLSPMRYNILHQGKPNELCDMWYLVPVSPMSPMLINKPHQGTPSELDF